MKLLTIIGLVFVTQLQSLSACSFDTDCGVGSQCIKQGYNIYGMCVGGINPGNNYDQQPIRNMNPINQRYGDTCSFDTDCDVGHHCIKSNFSIQGVCN